MKNNKGITLMVLVLTLVVLLILISIISHTSYTVLDNAKFEVFTTELKIMQQEVNMLYQKTQTGDGTIQIGNDTYNIIQDEKNNDSVNKTVGKEINSDSIFENAFIGAGGISEEDKSQYRYYDKETINLLDLEDINQEFLVNVQTKTVISLNGFEHNSKKYYTLKQLSETYNVEYEDPHKEGDIDFDVSVEHLENNSWEIKITNIKVSKYVSEDEYTIEYQLEGTDYWTKSEKDTFIVYNEGTYNIKLTDLSGNSTIKNDILVPTP